MSLFALEASDPDPEELAGFFASETGDSAERIRERLDWQRRNPSRRPEVPPAFVVRTASGSIGGAMLCIPHRLARGDRKETVVMSSGFYVQRSMGAAGLQIFQEFRGLASQFVLYATTANAQAARVWQWAGAKSLADTDGELLRPLHWTPLCEEALVRRFGCRSAAFGRMLAPVAALKTTASRAAATRMGGELTPVETPEVAARPSEGEAWQPVRDAAFIRWRFFENPRVDARVYHFRNPRLGADGFVALTRSLRGYRQQVRTRFVADVWGDLPPGSFAALLEAVARRHRRTDDLLVIRSAPETHRCDALRVGFRRRSFQAPVGWYIDIRGVFDAQAAVIPTAASELV